MIEKAFESFPVLNSRSYLLREIDFADAEELFGILSNDDVTKYYDDDSFLSIQQAEEQIEVWRNGYNRHAIVRWGIESKEDKKLIGTCGLYGFHTLHMRASLGYELSHAYWGKGIMTEVLSKITDYAFKELEIVRLQAFVMKENIASVRLLGKLGFQNEGVLRKYEQWGSKGFLDLQCFSLLREEYENNSK